MLRQYQDHTSLMGLNILLRQSQVYCLHSGVRGRRGLPGDAADQGEHVSESSQLSVYHVHILVWPRGP